MPTVTVNQGVNLPDIAQLQLGAYAVQRFFKSMTAAQRALAAAELGDACSLIVYHWGGGIANFNWAEMDFAPGTLASPRVWTTSGSRQGLDDLMIRDLDALRANGQPNAKVLFVMHEPPEAIVDTSDSRWSTRSNNDIPWPSSGAFGSNRWTQALYGRMIADLWAKYPGRIFGFSYGQEMKGIGLAPRVGTRTTPANVDDYVDGYNSTAAYFHNVYGNAAELWGVHYNLWANQPNITTRHNAMDALIGGANVFETNDEPTVNRILGRLGRNPATGVFDPNLLPDRYTYDTSIVDFNAADTWRNDYAAQLARVSMEYHVARVLKQKMIALWGHTIPLVAAESYFDVRQSSATGFTPAQQAALSTAILMWAQRAGTTIHNRWEPQGGDAGNPNMASWWAPTGVIYPAWQQARDLVLTIPPGTVMKNVSSDTSSILCNAGHSPSGLDRAFMLNTSGGTLSVTVVSQNPNATVATVSIPAYSTASVALPAPTNTGPAKGDNFDRTTVDAWGVPTPASQGIAPWVVSEAAPARFDVNGTQGTIALPGPAQPATAVLPVVVTDFDETFTFSVDKVPVGGSVMVSPLLRYIDAGNEVRATIVVNPAAPPPPPGPAVVDTFTRTIPTAWSTAETGGTWGLFNGTSTTDFTVNGTQGTMTCHAGQSRNAQQDGPLLDGYVQAQFIMPSLPSGATAEFSLGARVVANQPVSQYRAVVKVATDGTLKMIIEKWVAGIRTTISGGGADTPVAGNLVAGTAMNFVFDARGSGPTTLQAKVWRQGTTEPTSWMIGPLSDNTPELQLQGGMRVCMFLNAGSTDVTALWDNVLFTSVAYPNQGGGGTTGPQVIFDSFTRAVSNGWGVPEVPTVGAAWTNAGGVAADYQVNGTAGTMQVSATQSRAMGMLTPTAQDAYIRGKFTIDALPVGASIELQLALRVVSRSPAVYYRVVAIVNTSGSVSLQVEKWDTTRTTLFGPTPVTTVQVGVPMVVVLDARGTSPTTLSAKLWSSNTTEPGSWQAQFTDSTANIQAAGSAIAGVFLGAGGTTQTIKWDDVELNTDVYSSGTGGGSTYLIQDPFSRTQSLSWGQALIGGLWLNAGGAGAEYSVNGSRGIMTGTPGASHSARMTTISNRDGYSHAQFMVPSLPTAGTFEMNIALRVVNFSPVTQYRAVVIIGTTGVASMQIEKWVAGTRTTLAGPTPIAGFTLALGIMNDFVFEVRGATPSSLTAKVWQTGQAEPSGWAMSLADSTPELQVAGAYSTGHFFSATAPSVSIQFDNVTLNTLPYTLGAG